jgi:hypothetical protein
MSERRTASTRITSASHKRRCRNRARPHGPVAGRGHVLRTGGACGMTIEILARVDTPAETAAKSINQEIEQ